MICSVLKRATTKYYLIQSFSDVITNSSSETYVVDTSYTAKALQRALEAIHKQHEYGVITLWIPYGEQPVDFYKAGLEAILDKHFKDNYKIEYE